MQAGYEFSSKDGGRTWTRRCFGIEQLVGVMASKTPGFGMLTGGYVVSFPHQVPASTLRIALEAAWIRLRVTAPLVAYKTKDAKREANGQPGYSLYFEYTVPENTQVARVWAKETIQWHEEEEDSHRPRRPRRPMTLRERDISLKNLWWRAPEEKYNYQLHVAPDVEENKWQILIHAAHWSADVRGTLQLSELLFTYLNEYLALGVDVEPSLEGIEWGEETKRLAPPLAIAGARAAGMPIDMLFPQPKTAPASAEEATSSKPERDAGTGTTDPDSGRDSDSDSDSDSGSGSGRVQAVNAPEEKRSGAGGGAPPAQEAPANNDPVLFLRSTPLLDASPAVFDTVAADVWLTRDETARFRDVCKRRGITVTQAITALKVVAEVEWALTHVEGRSDEEQRQTVQSYENATHIPSLWNVVDQRWKLKEYSRHDFPKGSVTTAAEGFPFMVNMATVRRLVKYDKLTKRVERDTSEEAFWDLLVKHAQDLWKSSDSDLPACLEREMLGHMYSTVYDPSAYDIPALMASSVGDIESLGLLSAFSPSSSKPDSESSESRLLIEQVSYGVRCPTPVKMVLAWQWNGRLLIRPQTASRWTSQKGMDRMAEILGEWIEETCLRVF